MYPKFGPDSEFILETDASYVGLGAVLSQRQDDGTVHPIAYASWSLEYMRRSTESLNLKHLAWCGPYVTFALICLGIKQQSLQIIQSIYSY